MVSDVAHFMGDGDRLVSIRFEVRGGFRPVCLAGRENERGFQSALRFAVVSDCVYHYRHRD